MIWPLCMFFGESEFARARRENADDEVRTAKARQAHMEALTAEIGDLMKQVVAGGPDGQRGPRDDR